MADKTEIDPPDFSKVDSDIEFVVESITKADQFACIYVHSRNKSSEAELMNLLFDFANRHMTEPHINGEAVH